MIGIGIDTGGTYTDAVIYDFEKEVVLAGGKAPTTHQNLEIGIEGALDTLPEDLLRQGEFLALSTTLATNACVEKKGGRAKLIFIGVEYKTVEEMYQKYGLPHPGEILFLDCADSRWEQILAEALPELKNYDSVAVVQIFAREDGGKWEKRVKEILEDELHIPCVCGNELFQERNVLRRGAGALLNAQLIPVIRSFVCEVRKVLKRKSLKIPIVVVRSDGSLMSLEFALEHPVETLLSGPAASVMAGVKLAGEPEALIVDMGGTTTDVAIVENGAAIVEKDGISLGQWKTFVKGVFVDTFGLGGDSAVRYHERKLYLDTRRIVPVCSLAARYPDVKAELRELLELEDGSSIHFLHEFLLLVKDIRGKSGYTEEEQLLCKRLKDGPMILSKAAKSLGRDPYSFHTERLEREGIVIRSGLTPTDIMHLCGDFTAFEREAAELTAAYVARCVGMDVFNLSRTVYQMVQEKLYCNLVRILWNRQNPCGKKYKNTQKWDDAVAQSFYMAQQKDAGMCKITFTTKAVLIGIGAPIHIFLEPVARMLGTRAVIPKEAPAANALGAVLGNVTAACKVEIQSKYNGGGIEAYLVSGLEQGEFENYEEAKRAAVESAKKMAAELVVKRGAVNYTVLVESKQTAPVVNAEKMFLSETVTARAIGKIGFPAETE